MAPSSPSRDAHRNDVAAALLADLEERKVTVDVRAGRLALTPRAKVTPDDLAVIAAHRIDVILLVLASDVRTLDRLAAMQVGTLVPGVPKVGHCSTCQAAHDDCGRIGPCGWCRLAAIHLAHWRVTQASATTGTVPAVLRLQAEAAVLQPRLLSLFPLAISGQMASLFVEVA